MARTASVYCGARDGSGVGILRSPVRGCSLCPQQSQGCDCRTRRGRKNEVCCGCAFFCQTSLLPPSSEYRVEMGIDLALLVVRRVCEGRGMSCMMFGLCYKSSCVSALASQLSFPLFPFNQDYPVVVVVFDLLLPYEYTRTNTTFSFVLRPNVGVVSAQSQSYNQPASMNRRPNLPYTVHMV